MSTKTLFVGNLPYTTSEADLMLHFGDFQPHAARIIATKGIAFLEIAEERAAEAIQALNGSTVGGRPIVVNEARPREERSGGGGYGGGRGGGGGYGRDRDRGGRRNDW